MIVLSSKLSQLVEENKPPSRLLDEGELRSLSRIFLSRKHRDLAVFNQGTTGGFRIDFNYADAGENSRWTTIYRTPITLTWSFAGIDQQNLLYRSILRPDYLDKKQNSNPDETVVGSLKLIWDETNPQDVIRTVSVIEKIHYIPNPSWLTNYLKEEIRYYVLHSDTAGILAYSILLKLIT